jgi:hypothetical protein
LPRKNLQVEDIHKALNSFSHFLCQKRSGRHNTTGYQPQAETFEEPSLLPKFPDKRNGTGEAGENVSADGCAWRLEKRHFV